MADVPRDRLHSIAARKLHLLSVPTSKNEDGELGGGLSFSAGGVAHPLTHAPLSGAHFVVEGHDHLRFTDAPLSALPPVKFYDVDTRAELEGRISEALVQRVRGLGALGERLQALKCSVRVDPQRLAILGVFEATGCQAELIATADGVRLHRIKRPQQAAEPAPRGFPAVPLDTLGDGSDLELFLTDALAKSQAAHAAPKAPMQRASLVAVPAGGITLRALEKLGLDASFPPGVKIELMQEFQLGNERYRFTATHEAGTRFRGRISGPAGEKWSDWVDLERFPGIPALMSLVLEANASAQAPEAKPSQALPDHLMPKPGEIWAMPTLVEGLGTEEVRYDALNADGQPYGAPRVLPRKSFEEMFEPYAGGFRMLIRVETVRDGTITYQHLDRGRQARGPTKQMQTAVFVTAFVPEESAF